MRLLLITLVLATAHTATAQSNALADLNWPVSPPYPSFDSLTSTPARGRAAAEAYEEAQRLQHALDSIAFPRVYDNPDCGVGALRRWSRAWYRAARRSHAPRVQVRDAYFAVFELGDADMAIAVARALGDMFLVTAENFAFDELEQCFGSNNVHAGRLLSVQWQERAVEAYSFCDALARHRFVREPACEAALERLDLRFDGTPEELVGHERLQHSDLRAEPLAATEHPPIALQIRRRLEPDEGNQRRLGDGSQAGP